MGCFGGIKMDDVFNFKLHIKEIITPIMKNLRFQKTNLNFTRTNGRYLEKIMLQKSQFNLAASEKTLFVNYYIYVQDEQSYWISFNRLENKMKYAFFDSWSFFDEDDLIKMLTFLGKLLYNYTNTFYEAMEKYDTINGAYNANLIRTMILEDDNSEEILNLGSNPYKIYEREDLC